MTDTPAEQQLTEDDETEARTAWLLSLTVEQISRFDATTIYDWLAARNEQHCARLRAACQTLREQSARRQRALNRITAAVAAVRSV